MKNTCTSDCKPKLSIQENIDDADLDFLKNFYTLDSQADWKLALTNDIYQLTNDHLKLDLCVDFRQGKYQFRHKNKSKEPLIQAIRIKQKLPKVVFDATPGMLKDLLVLVSHNIQVIAYERNPLLYTMVKQGLKFIENSQITYQFGDAVNYMHKHSYDVIYLDPMYPPSKKSAQVKKDMQILHKIIGADKDSEKLLDTACKQQARVIVKRPKTAQPLADKKPDYYSQLGSTRFDVYL